ncbi:MAG TPA: hypothetical protein VG122_22350 [Gemmata sp.]|jgi:hypothetical protein|nr:hypothetical protein [Gemmata sp.]
MVLLKTATDLVSEITTRFDRGDAAEALVERLVAQTTIIERYVSRLGDGLPSDCLAEIARLLAGVQAAVKRGNSWLVQADGPELAKQNLQRRVSRAYGLSTRNN